MAEREQFDVIVIGAGPAGENAAGRCAEGGLSVAIVERELVGGECSYWGCMPSKVLLRPGDVLAAARRVPGAARAVTGQVDAAATFARRDRFTGNWDDSGALPWLTDRGIEIVRGRGRLAGTRRVDIEDAGGSARTLTATLLVLGGGAIGLEMAQAFRRLGAESVTVIEAAPRLLFREESFAGDEVRAALEAEGITIHVGVGLASVERDGDGPVHAALADGTHVCGDEILVATGRRPSTSDLGLDTVGLEPGRFVDVDDQLRAVTVDGGWLYAIGDCNGRALLTHMGKYHARIAADVILGKDAAAIADHGNVPRVTFTDPQVAAVGLTEAQAVEASLDVRTVRHGTGAVAGASVLGQSFPGTSQLVIDEKRRVIVGATFVGPGVQELLHAAAVAIAGGVTLDQLWHAVPSFPTVSEVWLRLLEAYGL